MSFTCCRRAQRENLGPWGSIEQTLMQVRHPSEILNECEQLHYEESAARRVLCITEPDSYLMLA